MLLVLHISCEDTGDKIDKEWQARTNDCGTYPGQETSKFILPYNAGESYKISQGNCTNNSHRRGTLGQFAYDFLMPIGADILAVRSGTVVAIQEDFPNVEDTQRPGEENFVIINNLDGTQDRYFHLDQNGVHVKVGDNVAQGQLIATSGNSGGTPYPHLHLEVIQPFSGGGNPLPITFRNTSPHPTGLIQGQFYEAE